MLTIRQLEQLDVNGLQRLGTILDKPMAGEHGRTALDVMARRLLCVRTRDGKLALLRPNAVQEAFEKARGERNIVLKARQLGLTTWVAARFFLRTITHPGTLSLQVAHTQEAAEEIFRIVHRFADSLPEQLRNGPLKTSRANVRQIAFPELDSTYMVVSAGERNAGRGLTAQNLHCSELARWPGDPAETLAGLRAALAPNGEQVLESTPEGVGGCFYDEWQKAPETGMVQHFFPWWMEKRYRAKSVAPELWNENERELALRFGLDARQIGFRRQLHAEFRGLARQEYAEDAESCFIASGDAVFELSAIDARLSAVRDPVQMRRNRELRIWLPPVPGRQYLVAVDPAGGGSEGDYSAAQVVDVATGMQCAEFAGHVGGVELTRLICNLAAEYNQAWLVVERNNHGTGILALAEAVCHYPRIFCQDMKTGWLTNSVTRPAVLGRLGAALIEQPHLFQSRRLLAECRCFVRLPDGSTGARAGTHDDCVLAMAMALAARAEIALDSRHRAA